MFYRKRWPFGAWGAIAVVILLITGIVGELLNWTDSWVWIIAILIFLLVIGVNVYIRNLNNRTIHLFNQYIKDASLSLANMDDAEILRPKHLLHQLLMGASTTVSQQGVARESDGQSWLIFIQYALNVHQEIITFALRRLPAPVHGWMRIIPADNPIRARIPDVQLESMQFNKQVLLQAEPKKLATYVMAPNIITWYQNLPKGVWIHVEDDLVCAVLMSQPSPEQFDQLRQSRDAMCDLLTHSGALEK